MADIDPTGRLEALAREAQQVAQALDRGGPDPATAERQQQLYRRMLDAGRFLEQEERDDQGARESRAGDGRGTTRATGPASGEAGVRFAPPTWNDLRGLSADERRLVYEYFRRLNAANAVIAGACRSLRRLCVALITALWAASAWRPLASGEHVALHAQNAVMDALGHEDAGRFVEAAAAYRIVLDSALANPEGGDQIALALLGLERVWAQAAMRDSIIPVVNAVLARRPADPVARSIQFRSLSHRGT